MDNPGKTPIALMSFNRPDYLGQVLDSLVAQSGNVLAGRDIVLFQDGARNVVSGAERAKEADIEACVALFRSAFPNGAVLASVANLGVAFNFDRAEQYLFEDRRHEAAIFLEDDLVLEPRYIATMDQLIATFAADDRVAYVAAYGEHRLSLADQRKLAPTLRLLYHNWGFAVFRRQWLRIRPYVSEYLALLEGQDYRQRDHGRIAALFASWGYGNPASSQDSAKTIACNLVGAIKVNTNICLARYIGERGIHMSPAVFERMGYGATELFEGDIGPFEPIDDAHYMRLLQEQKQWAGKPSVQPA